MLGDEQCDFEASDDFFLSMNGNAIARDEDTIKAVMGYNTTHTEMVSSSRMPINQNIHKRPIDANVLGWTKLMVIRKLTNRPS